MKGRFSALVFFCVSALASSAGASSLSPLCEDSLLKANEKSVLQHCSSKEDLANDEVQFIMGKIYYEGKNVEGDFQKAKGWFEKSQENGNINAISALGTMYYFGAGVELDTATAAKLYEEAANKGSADGQMRYGVMLSLGQGGLIRDNEKAMEWFKIAAKKGNATAALNLGYAYLKGIGIEESAHKAYIYFSAAIAAGKEEMVKSYMAELNTKMEGLNRKMLNEQAQKFVNKYVLPNTPGTDEFIAAKKKKAEAEDNNDNS